MTGTTTLIPCSAEPIPGGLPLASWCEEGVSLGMSFADAFPSATAEACLAGEGLDEAASALSISFDLFAEESLAGPAARHAHVARAKDVRRRPVLQAAGSTAARSWKAPRFSRRRTATALRRA